MGCSSSAKFCNECNATIQNIYQSVYPKCQHLLCYQCYENIALEDKVSGLQLTILFCPVCCKQEEKQQPLQTKEQNQMRNQNYKDLKYQNLISKDQQESKSQQEKQKQINQVKSLLKEEFTKIKSISEVQIQNQSLLNKYQENEKMKQQIENNKLDQNNQDRKLLSQQDQKIIQPNLQESNALKHKIQELENLKIENQNQTKKLTQELSLIQQQNIQYQVQTEALKKEVVQFETQLQEKDKILKIQENEILHLKNQISSYLQKENNSSKPPQKITQSQLLQVYPRKSLRTLSNEFKHNNNIQSIIQQLSNKFDSYRSIRGDGNCYFRSVGFSYLEHLTRQTTSIQHLEDFINKIESKIGYYQIRPSQSQNNQHIRLHNVFLQLLQNLKQQKEQNYQQIQKFLIEELENNKDDQDEALV